MFLAGQGSGKSHCAGLVSANLIVNFPAMRGMICANSYEQLNRSTLFRIREVWRDSFNMEEYSARTGHGCYVAGKQPPANFVTTGHNFDSYEHIISFSNGAVIFMGSLDNYRALDGLEVCWAILDETKDTREEAVKRVVTGRLRQRGLYVDDGNALSSTDGRPYNPLYIFTSPANVAWLNDWFDLDEHAREINEQIFSQTTYFCKAVSDKFVTISSTYLNSANLPANYIDNQKANLDGSLQELLIYGSPFGRVGGAFYKCFDRARHVGRRAYDAALPLHISFDENTVPYLPLGIFQVVGLCVYMIDEIASASPGNTIAAVCAELRRRYASHSAGMYIYGDATSRKADVKLEQGYDFFRLVENELAMYKPARRVGRSNPAVVMRGNFINTVLEKELYGCTLLIDERCKKAIADFSLTRQAPDGTKDKRTTTDPDTHIAYQPHGHFTDLTDYLLCTIWAEQYARYQTGDKPRQFLLSPPRNGRF